VCHQQYELPPATPLVFEHARLRLCCPGCGRAVLADLPGPALSGYGPRLEAHIVMLAGVFRLSREQVRQIVVEVFGIPASKGAIDATIMRAVRFSPTRGSSSETPFARPKPFTWTRRPGGFQARPGGCGSPPRP
jgi:hypothetical protein